MQTARRVVLWAVMVVMGAGCAAAWGPGGDDEAWWRGGQSVQLTGDAEVAQADRRRARALLGSARLAREVTLPMAVTVHLARTGRRSLVGLQGWFFSRRSADDRLEAQLRWPVGGQTEMADFVVDLEAGTVQPSSPPARRLREVARSLVRGPVVDLTPGAFDPDGADLGQRWEQAWNPEKLVDRPRVRALDVLLRQPRAMAFIDHYAIGRATSLNWLHACHENWACTWPALRGDAPSDAKTPPEGGPVEVVLRMERRHETETLRWAVDPDSGRVHPAGPVTRAFRRVHGAAFAAVGPAVSSKRRSGGTGTSQRGGESGLACYPTARAAIHAAVRGAAGAR